MKTTIFAAALVAPFSHFVQALNMESIFETALAQQDNNEVPDIFTITVDDNECETAAKTDSLADFEACEGNRRCSRRVMRKLRRELGKCNASCVKIEKIYGMRLLKCKRTSDPDVCEEELDDWYEDASADCLNCEESADFWLELATARCANSRFFDQATCEAKAEERHLEKQAKCECRDSVTDEYGLERKLADCEDDAVENEAACKLEALKGLKDALKSECRNNAE